MRLLVYCRYTGQVTGNSFRVGTLFGVLFFHGTIYRVCSPGTKSFETLVDKEASMIVQELYIDEIYALPYCQCCFNSQIT